MGKFYSAQPPDRIRRAVSAISVLRYAAIACL
jgi:hypothetical protein